jgi:hypothetical protein
MQWRARPEVSGPARRMQPPMAREIASILLRNSLGALDSDPASCSRCRRVPLIGELMHELESGREVCSLCLSASEGRDGEPVRSQRVRATDKPLSVVPRAA